MVDEAIYNPATGDYSVPEGGGGINVGVSTLQPLPTLGGSYSADGTNSAGPDLTQWLSTLSGIGVNWYRAATGQPSAGPAAVPGAARIPTPGNTSPVTQQAGMGTLMVVLFVALLVYFGVKRR